MPANLKILVVDDHETFLHGTIDLLKNRYPSAEFSTAQTAEAVLKALSQGQFDLVVLDLSIPQTVNDQAQTETGVQLLKSMMQTYPSQNLMVYSTYIKALIRIRSNIASHEGGFTITDKRFQRAEMFRRVNLALEGAAHTKEIRSGNGLEVKPIWLELLKLAFHESLTDAAIAKRLNVADRTVRQYWTKIYDVLDIYPEDDKQSGKNLRVQTEKRAREMGLID